MQIRILLMFTGILLLTQTRAQTTGWNKGISCIVYSHCTSCHNPNGLAPTSFTSYQQVYNSRFSIQQAVNDRKMPPYPPNTQYKRYAHEKKLTDAEINLINQWVNEGGPLGDTANSLPVPVYQNQEVITQPDVALQIPAFNVPSLNNDLYQAFVISNPNSTEKYITEIEVVPGNRNIVHHVLVFQDTSNRVVTLDSATAGPGYVSFGGIGSNSAQLIGTWVPGTSSFQFPSGMGVKLSVGARIIVQIHYPLGSSGQSDQTKVKFRYSSTPVRSISISPVLNHANLTNGPLFIPANTVKTFHAQQRIPLNATVIAIGPHGHLLCKMFEVFGITTQGDTIKLIKIDDWDFHWQGNYDFQKPIKIPAGTTLHSYATYDNTANNPDNPSSPPQDVSQGESTTDEMMLVYFAYTGYQQGDENIIVDTASHSKHYLDCAPDYSNEPVSNIEEWNIYPNPVSQILHLESPTGVVTFAANIFDMQGRLVKYVINEKQIDVSALASGTYVIMIQSENGMTRRKFIKT